MKKIALAVCNLFKDYHSCDKILAEGLSKNGFEVAKEFWDDETCKWDKYDLVILRSACDYIDNVDKFLAWVKNVSKITNLVNNEELIKNNYNKIYLKRLESKGIDIIPTQIADSVNDLITVINNLEYDDLVIKGAVDAKGQRTFRFNKNQLSEIFETVSNLNVSYKTPLLVQPFLKDVEENGEISAMFFDGKFSFAVKRKTIIDNGNMTTSENEVEYQPSNEEIEFCIKVLNLYEHTPMYAKIDYVLNDGKPLLVKTGLIEPNLYFHVSPSHTQDFINAINEKISG